MILGLPSHRRMRIESMARKKVDAGHEETEKVLSDIEKRIAKEYRQAEEEVAEKLDKYMKRFEAKDAKKRTALKNGLITQKEYDEWKVGQIAMGERWEQLRQNLATDFTNADQIARSVTAEHMPEVYAINMNYGTYQIEHDTKINTNFTLYDRQTVERLADDSNDIIPVPGKRISALINEGKAQRWNNQQIQSVMMQSILQGESIPKIAKRLAREVGEKDRRAAVRNARTLTTGVQNAGRVDSYKRAEKMGIPLEQQWVATLDGRTRHEHRILDGQTAPVGGKFKVEGYEIAYPGEPGAPGHLIYNCRCTLIASTKGFEKDLSDLSLRRDDKLGDMTYEEWKYAKTPRKSKAKTTGSTGNTNLEKSVEDTQNYLQLSKYVEGTMGMSLDKRVGLLDFQSVREGLEGVEHIQREFPKARAAFKSIRVSSLKNSLMETEYDGSIIINGKDYRTRKSVLDGHERAVGGVKNQNPYSTGAHEAGHLLEKALIDLDLGDDVSDDMKQYMWNECIYSHDIVNEAFIALKKTDKYHGETLDELKEQICTNALDNDSEALAYGVEDVYMNGSEAAPLASMIWKILKRELG